TGFDRWIQNNIYDLAAGRKQFINIFNGTSANSTEQARRVASMLDRAGLSHDCMVTDYRNSRQVLDEQSITTHGIVYKYSTVNVHSRGAHSSVSNIYVGQLMSALGGRPRSEFPDQTVATRESPVVPFRPRMPDLPSSTSEPPSALAALRPI